MNLEYLNLNIIGADETGVGDFLTPLVAAAVYVPHQNVNKLVSLGVTDSKNLTDKNILNIFEKIKPYIKSSVRYLSQSQYNFLTENKKYNAHELKTLLHFKAINAIEERIKDADLIIIDKYADEKNFLKYKNHLLKEDEEIKELKTKVKLIEKGELEHVAVGAASIVARSYLLNLMDEQEKKWNFKFLLGTNPRVEQNAKDFINIHGKNNLYKIAKKSFKTWKKILD